MRRDWLALLVLLVLLVAVASWRGWLWRVDMAIYDVALPTVPARADLVIVAVDEHSVTSLGRWPWPRDRHAQLLDRLRDAGVAAVSFSVLFPEPDVDSPESDAAFAEALRRGPPSVLAVAFRQDAGTGGLVVSPPIPLLGGAAATLGHVQVAIDADGVVRNVLLREDTAAGSVEHLSLALAGIAADGDVAAARTARDDEALPRLRLPFVGPAGSIARFSYADVLDGSVPASRLAGKRVLVGVTAAGIGPLYVTPNSVGRPAMTGVELNANVLNALLGGYGIREVPPLAATLFACVPLVLVFVGFVRLPVQTVPVMAIAGWLGTLLASVLALRFAGWWWPPSVALAAMLVAYPLWSWRRLQGLNTFLEAELERLISVPSPFLRIPQRAVRGRRAADPVQRQVELLGAATERLRGLHVLLADTVASLPDAALVGDADGQVVIANPAAETLLGGPQGGHLEGRSVARLLDPLLAAAGTKFAEAWLRAPCSLEVSGWRGHDLLVRITPFREDGPLRGGTLVNLVDLSEVRRAQRERDDVLRFLSHDIRSPATSLLALARVQRDPARALPQAALVERIEALSYRILALADGFVELARAEAADDLSFTECDLRDPVQDAVDETWAAAVEKRIPITARLGDRPALVRGDRQLLARAVANLLTNAVKFSAPGAAVTIDCARRGDRWAVSVTDRGAGIAAQNQAGLFQRFRRGLHEGETDGGGVGLGLSFVSVVAAKHGGAVSASSQPGEGSTFILELPAVE